MKRFRIKDLMVQLPSADVDPCGVCSVNDTFCPGMTPCPTPTKDWCGPFTPCLDYTPCRCSLQFTPCWCSMGYTPCQGITPCRTPTNDGCRLVTPCVGYTPCAAYTPCQGITPCRAPTDDWCGLVGTCRGYTPCAARTPVCDGETILTPITYNCGDPMMTEQYLGILKQQLREALQRVEAEEQALVQSQQPQTMAEIEALEQKLTEALEELKAQRERLQK